MRRVVVTPAGRARYLEVNGSALCVHFAFHTQRDFLERETDVLQRYRELTRKLREQHPPAALALAPVPQPKSKKKAPVVT